MIQPPAAPGTALQPLSDGGAGLTTSTKLVVLPRAVAERLVVPTASACTVPSASQVATDGTDELSCDSPVRSVPFSQVP